MEIPPVSHPVWSNLAQGKITVDFDFLPTRIMVGNFSRDLAKDGSEGKLSQLSNELREMFVRNINLPKVQKDLEKILNLGV